MNGPGGGYGAYEPPKSAGAAVPALLWYRVYAVTMAFYYGSAAVRAYFAMARFHHWAALPIAIGVSAVGALLFFAAAFVPRTPRGWTCGLVAIAFGLLSCMFPAAIALLVFWARPVTKAAFGRV